MRKRKTYVPKLEKPDPAKELRFEIDFQLSLTTAERFQMMFQMSDQIKELLLRKGYRKPCEIIKRT